MKNGFFRTFMFVLLVVVMLLSGSIVMAESGKAGISAVGKKEMNFTDVPKDHKYYEDIRWAYEKGLISGYADGTFKPDQTAKKIEFFALAYKLWGQEDYIRERMEWLGNSILKMYVDVPEKSWMSSVASFCAATGGSYGEHILYGKDGSVKRALEPNAALLRWRVAIYVGGSLFFTGNDGDWAPPKRLNKERKLAEDVYYVSESEDFLADKHYSFEIDFRADRGEEDKKAISRVIFSGIMKLLSSEALELDNDGNFNIHQEVTRGEMVRLIRKIDESYGGKNPFSFFLNKKGR